MDDLENQMAFFTDEELLKELKRRYDYLVFAGLKAYFGPNQSHSIVFSSKGQPHVCIGLLHDLGFRLSADQQAGIGQGENEND